MSTEADRLWEAAVRSALLGTEREPGALPVEAEPDAPAVERALARLAERGSEARLLGSAAVLSLYRRAGRLPSRDERLLPEPVPEETARPLPPAAARHLGDLLSGRESVVLPEWLEIAARRGMVVPGELLPTLMHAVAGRAELRDAALPVLGERGRWLAAMDPEWTWALGHSADPGEAWETGTSAARVTLLRLLRRTDPARGLALVRSTWAADAPKDRAAFVAELAAGLSDADEDFLESVLDDRRKEVRQAAAEVLRRLPTSRLVARMAERARPLLRITLPSGGLVSRLTGAKPEVAVELPAECTKEMQRDGINPAPPLNTGERAWWLQQVVAAAPTSLWSADAPPEAWIAAVQRSEWAKTLLPALADAAERHRDADWAEALVRAGPGWGSLSQLVSVLPPDRYRALGLTLLAADRSALTGGEAAARYLAASPHPLGAELTAALFARLNAGTLATDWGLRESLREMAPRIDPAAALKAMAGWEAQPRGAWIDLLHFRHALHEAFAS